MIKQFALIAMIFFSSLGVTREISHYTAGRLQQANQLAQNDKLKQAIEVLHETKASFDYDKAFVARVMAVFYWQDGKPKQAIEKMRYAVASGLLQDEQAWVSQRMLADLYLTEHDFKQALKHYYQLVKVIPPTQQKDDIWLRIAQSHYQLEQWRDVIVATDRYLSADSNDRLQPLSLKLGAQLALKFSHDAIGTLGQLIAIEPNKLQWWRQLSVLQTQIGQGKQALGTLSLAKLKGLPLSQNDRRILAQLYSKHGIPEKAAIEISELEEAQTDIKLLVEQATYWQLAKEWDSAISVWKKAARIEPRYNWNLAQLLVQQGHYRASIPVLDNIKDKKADVALVKTRAFYKLNQLDKALYQAKQSDSFEPSIQAKNWIKFLSQVRGSSNSNQSDV
ncbi:tetratricopeptide repeat protein [Vibrio hepatarius]|uniref:tetratricopeptide repeat protein n=1 Tax=Vibrio hepatarius TaxID=171383 RepID=UPI001C07FFE2|nr:hypothetical protein [Vibrio hepatarius]MBU2897393.1 hypothetical protein [Vibrio hepatarius]